MNVTGEHGRLRVRWLALPAVTAYAWGATTLRPFTHPALLVTLLTAGLVVFLGARARSRTPVDLSSAGLAGVVWWYWLFAAVAAWELAAFLQLPRIEHPTLSSLANQVFDGHLVRTLAFAAWMAAGYGIARR